MTRSRKMRIDTTVVETPIRYPSDSRGSAKTRHAGSVSRGRARAVREGDCAHDVSQRATKHRTAAARDHAHLSRRPIARDAGSLPPQALWAASGHHAPGAATRGANQRKARVASGRNLSGRARRQREDDGGNGSRKLGGRVVTQTKQRVFKRRDECRRQDRQRVRAGDKDPSPRQSPQAHGVWPEWSRCRRPRAGSLPTSRS